MYRGWFAKQWVTIFKQANRDIVTAITRFFTYVILWVVYVFNPQLLALSWVFIIITTPFALVSFIRRGDNGRKNDSHQQI